MNHRHLRTPKWTRAAIDSTLERGNLKDWRELFSEARRNREVAESILKVASKPDKDGATRLAEALIAGIYPEMVK